MGSIIATIKGISDFVNGEAQELEEYIGFQPSAHEVEAIKQAVCDHIMSGKSSKPMPSMPKTKHIVALCNMGLITRKCLDANVEFFVAAGTDSEH